MSEGINLQSEVREAEGGENDSFEDYQDPKI